MAESKRATSCGVRRVEAQVALWFGSAAVKATWPGWLLGLGLLDWASSILVAGQFDWTVGLVCGRFSWTVAFGLDWGLGRCSWARPKVEAEGKEVGLLYRVLGLGWPGSMDLVFLNRLRPIFRRIFSLLSAAFSLPISVLFLPFPLCLSSFFPSSKFSGLKVPKTTDLRTFRKTQFFDLGYRRRCLRKGTKVPWVIVLSLGILLVVVTKCLASVLGWFEARRRNWKLSDLIWNLSLSLSLLVIFPVCRYSYRFWESRAEGWARCGCRFAWGPWNSAVAVKLASFPGTEFFFLLFFFFFFFFFFFWVVT